MTPTRLPNRSAMGGFTLVEAVTVIAIVGILSAIVASFIRVPMQGYAEAEARAKLTEAADTAVRRMAREVQSALPNSLRASAGADSHCVEFLPTVGGGRYRVAPNDAGSGDVLDFSTDDAAFDVLASSGLPPAGGYGAATYHAVVYNLGIPGADAYDITNKNRAAISSSSAASPITLAAANQFPLQSPANRFHVIPNYSVTYTCVGNALIRSERPITAAPTACPTAPEGVVLMNNVWCPGTTFVYTPAASQRNGILAITLMLARPDTVGVQQLSLYQEVHVNNVP